MAFEGIRRGIDAFQRRPAIAFVLRVQKRMGDDGGGNLAAGLTYFAFLSIFPLLLVAASVLGFALANDPAAQARVANKLAGSIPGLGRLLADNVKALVDARGAAGVVGVLGALWSGTALARASSFSLSRISRKPEQGTFLQTQLWAIGSTVGLGALALVATAAGAALPAAAFSNAAGAALGVLGVAAGLALDLILFTVCYRVLNRSESPPLRQLWRGALIPAVGWTALKYLGTWYAARTVKGSTAVFGAFASVVGILVILYLVSRLFIYGAELNAVLREKTPPEARADTMRPVAVA
jgi:inner membrane protein YhjD